MFAGLYHPSQLKEVVKDFQAPVKVAAKYKLD